MPFHIGEEALSRKGRAFDRTGAHLFCVLDIREYRFGSGTHGFPVPELIHIEEISSDPTPARVLFRPLRLACRGVFEFASAILLVPPTHKQPIAVS